MHFLYGVIVGAVAGFVGAFFSHNALSNEFYAYKNEIVNEIKKLKSVL